MSFNTSEILPSNQKVVKFDHVIKSPGTPGVALVTNFSDVLPMCKKLANSLCETREKLEDEGDFESLRKLHFDKKNFDKFIFAIQFIINGNPYHVNIALFKIKDGKFANNNFALALENYFEDNVFNTIHYEVTGCDTRKDGKEYHHFQIRFHKRKVWLLEVNQNESFKKLHKIGLDGYKPFNPIFGSMRVNFVDSKQDYEDLRKYFQI